MLTTHEPTRAGLERAAGAVPGTWPVPALIRAARRRWAPPTTRPTGPR